MAWKPAPVTFRPCSGSLSLASRPSATTSAVGANSRMRASALSPAASHGASARAQRQRQVEVEALALAGAGLVRVAPEVGIVVGGIGVDRDGEHVVALEEDALRAVAVMDVDIEHGDARMPAAQALGGDGGVVQEAEAARHVGIGVMAGRPAERIGLARARRAPGRRPSSRPRSRRGLRPRCAARSGRRGRPGASRRGRPAPSDRSRDSAPDGRWARPRPRRSGSFAQSRAMVLQEVDVVRRVHACGRRGAVAPWARRPRGRRPSPRPAGASARSGCSALRCFTPRTKKVCGSCWACLSE